MKYSQEQLLQKLSEFRKLPKETEWLEFKEAGNNYSFDKLGKYFSALSNEAHLQSVEYGWLIFGVENTNKDIVGTAYRKNKSLEDLKHEIARHTTVNISFIAIYELNLPEGRVVMFQIPPAPKGIPIAWQGHFYGRDGESLVALNLQKIETIRGVIQDWSKEEYIKKRGLDKHYYEQLIIEYLRQFKQATRKDIDDLLLDKLPNILTFDQKRNKIRNLLHEMSRKKGIIKNQGSARSALWVLTT